MRTSILAAFCLLAVVLVAPRAGAQVYPRSTPAPLAELPGGTRDLGGYAEVSLLEGMLTMMQAAEASRRHGLLYSANVAGFQNALPNATLLANGHTGYASEPVDGVAATQGSLGYGPVVSAGANVGCQLTAFGTYSQVYYLGIDDSERVLTAFGLR